MFSNRSVEFRALVKTLALIVLIAVCGVASVTIAHWLGAQTILAIIAGGLAGYLIYMVYQVILGWERLNQK